LAHLPSFPTRRSSDLRKVDFRLRVLLGHAKRRPAASPARLVDKLDVIEKRHHLVELLLRERIVLVVVTLRAPHARSEPGQAHGRSEEHTSELQSPDHL